MCERDCLERQRRGLQPAVWCTVCCVDFLIVTTEVAASAPCSASPSSSLSSSLSLSWPLRSCARVRLAQTV